VWVTAGHVVDRLLEIRDDKSVVVESCQLIDDYQDIEAAFIPFALEDVKASSSFWA
jgi:hypothetical protein